MAEFDPAAFTPFRAKFQLAVAQFLLKPLYFIYNHIKIIGQENVPKSGPLLIVSNHLSLLDPALLLVACNRPLAYLAKIELFAVPFLKDFIKFAGAISLNRAHPGLATFKEVKEIFQRNWALAVFIEGTRNKTPGRLRQPHLGAAYIAHLNQVPILPVGIIGTNKPWGQAEVRIGLPIMPKEDLNATTWMIMEQIAQLTGFSLPPQLQIHHRRRRRKAAIRLGKRKAKLQKQTSKTKFENK